MVKIINTLRQNSPIGSLISQLGETMFGDQLGNDLRREELRAAQRGNVETEALMRMVSEGGAREFDPFAQAALIGSGYSPDDYGQIGLMDAATNLGARDPATTNWLTATGQYQTSPERFDLDRTEAARQADQTNATDIFGIETDSGDFRYNVDRDFASEEANRALDQEQWFGTPTNALDVNGNPVFAPQGDLVGGDYAPILSNTDRQGTLAPGILDDPNATPEQLAYVDAEPGDATPRTYQTPDGQTGTTLDGGRTDMHTGAPLPQGTTTFTQGVQATDVGGLASGVTTPLYRALYASEDALAMGEELLAAAKTASPEQFGAAGGIVNLVRGGVNTIANLAGLVGADLDSESLRAQVGAMSPSLSPTTLDILFSPQANATQALAGLYIYQVAATLSGQTGQDLSDRDVQRAVSVIGDPVGWGTSQATFLANVQRAQGLIANQIARTRERLDLGPTEVAPVTAIPGAPKVPSQSAPASQNDVVPGFFAESDAMFAPTPGTIEEGYRYIGGDPADPNSWEPVQ